MEKKEPSSPTLTEHATPIDDAEKGVRDFSSEEEKRLYRKIDFRLMPILALMYLLAFMDRGNIGNAKLEGLLDQLQMSSGQYSVALIVFFIPYALFEPPSNLVLKKFRPSRYLPAIMFVWGVVMTLMGIVKTYPQLVGARIALGVAEAGLFPGVVYFLTFWYPRHMLPLRVGLFFGAATIAGAFSGLLAYGISFMHGVSGVRGWSWIFILEGLATILVSGLAALVLRGCDSPETASFLTEEERDFILRTQRYASGNVAEDEGYRKEYLRAAATDWQVWISIITYMSVVCPLYACALFLPSIINDFGYDRAISQLLTVPPFVFATIITVTFAICSDRLKKRSPFIMAGQIMALIGFIINISPAPSGVRYFGMFLCTAGSYSAFPGVVAWLSNNLAPTYKRGIGVAIQIGIGNLSGAIAAGVYRTKDSPRYILGHSVQIGFLGLGLISLPLTVLIYTRINASRDERAARDGGYDKYSDEDLSRMGDRAPSFRYLL